MELKDRREMNPRDTWDLTPIYPNDAAWEADMAGMPEAIRALGGLPGTLGQSAEALADGLEAVMSASQRAERLYAYAFCANRATTAIRTARKWKPAASAC